MTSKIQTTVQIGFGEGAASPPISIEGDPGVYADQNVHLLLISPVSCTVRASDGEVRLGNVKPVPVPPGIVTFSGSNTSSLPKVPFQSGVGFQHLFGFDEKGNSISASYHYNPKTYQVEANKSLHGAARYGAYTARAQELIYTPVIAGGQTLYGVIAAFAPPSTMITYQVQPVSDETVDIEIYRIVSDAITTSEGKFELPNDYPTGGDYTNPANSYVLDVTTALKTERTHEVGIMGLGGRIGVRKYFVPIYQPFQGSLTYKPKLRCVPSALPPELSASEVAKAKSAIAAIGYGCK